MVAKNIQIFRDTFQPKPLSTKYFFFPDRHYPSFPRYNITNLFSPLG